jgi:hypothetical protein
MQSLLPPLIDDKAKQPTMTLRLQVMIDQIQELRDCRLEATHWTEEMTHRRIRLLRHRETGIHIPVTYLLDNFLQKLLHWCHMGLVRV